MYAEMEPWSLSAENGVAHNLVANSKMVSCPRVRLGSSAPGVVTSYLDRRLRFEIEYDRPSMSPVNAIIPATPLRR